MLSLMFLMFTVFNMFIYKNTAEELCWVETSCTCCQAVAVTEEPAGTWGQPRHLCGWFSAGPWGVGQTALVAWWRCLRCFRQCCSPAGAHSTVPAQLLPRPFISHHPAWSGNTSTSCSLPSSFAWPQATLHLWKGGKVVIYCIYNNMPSHDITCMTLHLGVMP